MDPARPTDRALANALAFERQALLYQSVKLCFLLGPKDPDAAARRMRRKVGHSMWLGARQAAAWRRPSRMSVSLRIVLSSSSALARSIGPSMRGRPSGA